MTKMHLMWFCAFSPHAGFGLDGWAGPRTGTGYDWTRPELWQDMAVALERAKFDLIMLGDSLAVPGTYQGRMDAYLRYAEHAPFHDPSPLVAIMAAATRRIGLAATLSTTFYPPFLLARLMTTLDHLSRGRIAWNVVTSYKVEEALNFGYQELLDHDQRYDRADEYMELCYQLWSSWDPDAVVMDPRTDTFADPAKVRAIDFEGTYYRSRGPLNATPSPQGRPVIIQAGASERGQDFAARHAEAVIVARETVDEMKQYYDAFKARVKKHGRDPDECKVFFLTKPIIGDTDEAAQQRADELYANAPVEAGLASLSTHAADRSVDLRSRSAAARRDPDAGDPGHPQPARSVLPVRADADPAGHRDPQGQHRLEAVHRDAGARRRRAGAHHRRGRRRWLRHPAGHLAGLRRPVRGAGHPAAPAARRRAHGVHGDDTAGAPAGVLAGHR